jgi:hypothetical protein
MNTKELGGYQVLQESEKTPDGAEGKSSFPAGGTERAGAGRRSWYHKRFQ